MTTGALLFLVGSWLFVLSLTAWCYARILRPPRSKAGPPPGDVGAGDAPTGDGMGLITP